MRPLAATRVAFVILSECMFRYTPTSLNSTTGYFDLVVKAYPPGGGDGVSSYITSLKPGDNIEVKGCYTKKKIVANQYKQIGLIAGGSGLTPMLQVAQELLNTVEEPVKHWYTAERRGRGMS